MLPKTLVLSGFVSIAVAAATTHGDSPKDARVPRALPPKWPKAVSDVFFPDARKKLIGERPNYGAAATAPKALNPAALTGGDLPQPTGDTFAWSKLISRETIEDEVKSLQKQVSGNITTPAKFKGGGFKAGRKHFTELALLFAIIAQYDGEVRWKDKAGGIRDLMARASYNSKVGTDATYAEAKLRKDDIEQLVQGGNVNAPEGNPDAKWDKIADRPPLMQRLEQAHQQGVTPWTANSGKFSKNSAVLLREAELIAAIAEAIQQEGFEFSDDETYAGFARQMREAALEVVGAVKGKNYDAARAASGNLEKACSGCHEGFRS